MILLAFLILVYILICLTLSWVFPKAGVESSKAWIPGVNFAAWCEIIGRKKSHAWWLLFPIVNIFIMAGMCVDLVRSFGKMDFMDSFFAVVFPPWIFGKIGKDENCKYIEPAYIKEKEYHKELSVAFKAKDISRYERIKSNSRYAKSGLREWVESLVFAIFAASFIRMFLIEAYVIPTPSMEGSLKVGDFLFVSKAHYGIRMPKTIAMLPLLHNRVPFFNCESYLEKPSLPYLRLPALSPIKRNDPFVFNWPVGDSVYVTAERSWTAFQAKTVPSAMEECKGLPLITRPMDKADHYIKRCVGMPGDSLKVVNRQLYINGNPAQNPEHMQYLYQVKSGGTPISLKKLDEWGVNVNEIAPQLGLFNLDQKTVDRIKAIGPDVTVEYFDPPGESDVFPNDRTHYPNWTFNDYGPIWIPKKGVTINLSMENIAMFWRIISVYEENKFRIENNQIYINDQVATQYTFKQNYYWAMGDNRNNSEDSRAWGFVPEDHIVGKPLFIWFSLKNSRLKDGINWKRVFTSANKS